MPEISLFNAKTHLSKLIEDLLAGHETEYVLTRHGKPVARLSPLKGVETQLRIGVAKGEFEVPDDIDRSNELVRAAMEGESIGNRPGR